MKKEVVAIAGTVGFELGVGVFAVVCILVFPKVVVGSDVVGELVGLKNVDF